MEAVARPPEFDAGIIEHRRAMLSFARSLVGDMDRAEDLVSDAIIRAMANYQQFHDGSNLKAWLFTILRNGLFSQHRKSGREVSDPDGVFASNVPVNEAQSWAVDLKVIRKRMRMLSPEQRKMVELVAILGHEYEEAAVELGVPIGTVKSGLHRARHYLETGEEIAEPLDETLEVMAPNSGADHIEKLYREGLSVAEIKAAIDGVSRSEIMQVILDRKLSAKRA